MISSSDRTNKTMKIGIDEAGRGPLFGRVYAAAVILPDDLDTQDIKDSKLFHSTKKREKVAAYIREHAISYSIQFEDEATIEKINILQATQNAMHRCVHDILTQHNKKNVEILVDGNYFRPFTWFDKEEKRWEELPYQCIVDGDKKIPAIAAASILAKVARDHYIVDLCTEHPNLQEKYGLLQNKGYGTKQHREGLQIHGPSPWHRPSFLKKIL